MCEIIDYKVVSSCGSTDDFGSLDVDSLTDRLSQIVLFGIKGGWEPLGSIVINENTMYQALVKYKKKDKL